MLMFLCVLSVCVASGPSIYIPVEDLSISHRYTNRCCKQCDMLENMTLKCKYL